MFNSNSVLVVFLFILSSIVIFDLGYLIYHGISWSDELMMIVWYYALFIPVYLVGRIISKKKKRLLYKTMGIIGMVILVWFTLQTYDFAWSFDSFSIGMLYIVFGGTGVFIYYYFSSHKWPVQEDPFEKLKK